MTDYFRRDNLPMTTSGILAKLSWLRLSCTLVNIRLVPDMKAHPVSVCQAIVKDVTARLSGGETEHIFFHIRDRKFISSMREGEPLSVDIFFCRHTPADVDLWRTALIDYLVDPVWGRNYDLVELGIPAERCLEDVSRGVGSVAPEGEICLEFLTPLPFHTDHRRTFITTETFVQAYERRFKRLFGIDVPCKRSAGDFAVLPYYWNYTDIKRPSASQPGTTQFIRGCIGKLYLKGDFREFLPYVILGSELHTGTKLSNAQGYYRLYSSSAPFFADCFPNRKAIVSVIRDVIDRYDHAMESLSAKEKFPFNEEAFAGEIEGRLQEKAYQPSPNVAFAVEKKSGASRLVERLDFRDLIVQQYLLKTIGKYFDRMFEEESIGFRKGLSRKQALEVFQTAVAAGYQYVIESDIDDFFPSVDLNGLERLLNFYIPAKDICLKDALLKAIGSGYILGGTLHERESGLAQGAPLSPILANLYLDAFDEAIHRLNVKMVRYADDFIILTKTREEAENVLSHTEAFLSEIGLKIKKEKTAIRTIREGFTFLGMRFDQTGDDESPEETFQRMKKPLYVTEPYCFLSLNGEAIDIRKDKSVVAAIPLRRISEIMVMEKTAFSTALIRKCVEGNIPFTIALNSGYYITTIKPDSKKYYDINAQHAKRYYTLSDTEILCIAKEFAAGKLKNYIALFRQRYTKDLNRFIGEMERNIQHIYEACDIHQIRGYEGATAKKIFQQLNAYIEDDAFKIRKRDREKPDPINSLLNFGYYLLFSRINATVRAMGLNPYLGFLHSPEDNYESLVCDIEELFRSRIDRFLIRLINLKIITKNDFKATDQGFYLLADARRTFLNQFEGEMERKNAKNVLSLKESLYVQCYVLKSFLLEGKSLSFYEWQV
jgi:CRISPR-associated endonuclease Cas1/group II intron reverse transcriptase/maturase